MRENPLVIHDIFYSLVQSWKLTGYTIHTRSVGHSFSVLACWWSQNNGLKKPDKTEKLLLLSHEWMVITVNYRHHTLCRSLCLPGHFVYRISIYSIDPVVEDVRRMLKRTRKVKVQRFVSAESSAKLRD